VGRKEAVATSSGLEATCQYRTLICSTHALEILHVTTLKIGLLLTFAAVVSFAIL
jgi:hypothetical protein